ncbi:hypothetical protein HPT25_07380 [Bacillus sp. BRMEA1]|uniref:hypothetical protein n=1 Tax=Neobacillus endophyticus TaxID=2738405 RepID=UPI00156759B3|nr:hypothetical protein [Neobacillus endophyticus]NRD77319.1 hypothetical protein [Neobacillus endophyticus]
MHNKNETKKMYELTRMLEVPKSQRRLSYKTLEEMGLIEKRRNVKNMSEYHYLLNESQRKFKRGKNIHPFWIEGYALNIAPIHSEENFHLIEFSLENGDFLTFPFALEKGMDENYLKFLSVIGVQPLEKMVPEDVLIKRFGLLVTSQVVDGEISYDLHDICRLEELAKIRMTMRFSEKVLSGGAL